VPPGEAGPVPRELDATPDQLATSLGAAFAEALSSAPEGVWTGPVASAYGWHLVRVTARTPARPARFEEVRASVVETESAFRREEAVARFLEKAFERYRVTVDGRPLTKIAPTRRVAFRSVSSGED
jgi:hypothetical protein